MWCGYRVLCPTIPGRGCRTCLARSDSQIPSPVSLLASARLLTHSITAGLSSQSDARIAGLSCRLSQQREAGTGGWCGGAGGGWWGENGQAGKLWAGRPALLYQLQSGRRPVQPCPASDSPQWAGRRLWYNQDACVALRHVSRLPNPPSRTLSPPAQPQFYSHLPQHVSTSTQFALHGINILDRLAAHSFRPAAQFSPAPPPGLKHPVLLLAVNGFPSLVSLQGRAVLQPTVDCCVAVQAGGDSVSVGRIPLSWPASGGPPVSTHCQLSVQHKNRYFCKSTFILSNCEKVKMN